MALTNEEYQSPEEYPPREEYAALEDYGSPPPTEENSREYPTTGEYPPTEEEHTPKQYAAIGSSSWKPTAPLRLKPLVTPKLFSSALAGIAPKAEMMGDIVRTWANTIL